MDQSDAGSVGVFPRWTNQTQEACVYSHEGKEKVFRVDAALPLPRTSVAGSEIGLDTDIPTMDQSDVGSV
eukprot:9006639-Pyramimonas_sp.AAC.1